MILNGSYTATVDRTTDSIATVLVESEGHTVAQYEVDVADLPDGAGEGSVLTARFVDSSLTNMDYNPDETDYRQKKAQQRFDRLSTRLCER